MFRQCVTFKYIDAETVAPPDTLPVPKFRLDYSFPYQNIGLDYAGQFSLKTAIIQKKMLKGYFLIITCCCARAAHWLQIFLQNGFYWTLLAILLIHLKPSKCTILCVIYELNGILYWKSPHGGADFMRGWYVKLKHSEENSWRKFIRLWASKYYICRNWKCYKLSPARWYNEKDIDKSLTRYHLIYGRNIATKCC